MRIAVLGSRHILSGYSGIEQVLKNTLPHLVARGHEVTVFGGPPPAAGAGAEWKGVRSVAIRGLRGKHAETLSRTALAIPRVLGGGFDVAVFTHQGPGLFSPVARLAGAASVVMVPGLDWQRAKWGKLASGAIRTAERVAVRWADGILVLSPRIGRYFAATYGRQTTYVPNGIEPTPPPASAEALAAFGVRPRGYVLFAARLVPEKACHELIAAWNGVETELKLVVAGGGAADDPYVRALHAAADPAKVVFTGHVKGPALAQLFGHAYAFVLPSHLEGQSVALLEALGAGRAVLVSDIPENLEAIEAGGFSFRVGDVAHLRSSLDWLVANPDAVRAMEAQVARAIRAWPDWQEVALRHEAAYAEAVALRHAATRRAARAPGGAVKP
jgi:glycosyltransferase involved in cell wall biosynthesis